MIISAISLCTHKKLGTRAHLFTVRRHPVAVHHSFQYLPLTALLLYVRVSVVFA